MKVLILITAYFMLLSIIVSSQNVSEPICTGIYEEPTKTYALDVCTEDTVLGFSIHNKYYCENDQIYRGFWLDNAHCTDNPNKRARIDSNIVCDGVSNCPYAIVRVFQSTLNCNSAYWTDWAYIVDVCVSSSVDGIGSEMLECGKIDGIIRKTYSGNSCDGDAIDSVEVIAGNHSCIINEDGFASELMSCHTRSNATSPIPFPTQEPTVPTPKPTAGGSATPTMAPTTPTTAPIPDMHDTDDTWFITGLVFICIFGVMLIGMVWLAYMVYSDRSSSTARYDRAPDHEAGVETTAQN